MNIRPALAVLALVAAAAPVAVAGTATAGDGDVVRRGSCTGSTDWKLKAKPDDGRIEVEGEVDSNRNGQDWRWRMGTTAPSPRAAGHHARPQRLVRGGAPDGRTGAAPTRSSSGPATPAPARSAAAASASDRRRARARPT